MTNIQIAAQKARANGSIPVGELPKNRKTMNKPYRVYRTRFVKKTGLPMYNTKEGKLLVQQHPEITGWSKRTARKAGVERSDIVIGFLRVYKGYATLRTLKERDPS